MMGMMIMNIFRILFSGILSVNMMVIICVVIIIIVVAAVVVKVIVFGSVLLFRTISSACKKRISIIFKT